MQLKFTIQPYQTDAADAVASVAVREGVAKSLAVTEGHFFEQYSKRI